MQVVEMAEHQQLILELNDQLQRSPKVQGIPLVRVRLVEERRVLTTVPIDGPEALAEVANRLIGDADREMLVCIHLNTKMHINSAEVVSAGSILETMACPREIFKGAILANSYAIALAHNHPSSSLEPSEEDLKLSSDISAAGRLLGIQLLDHLIVNGEGFFSIANGHPHLFQ